MKAADFSIFVALVMTIFTGTSLAQDAATGPHYVAKAAIEVRGAPEGDPATILMMNLPRNDVTVSLHRIPNTNVFEILAMAPDARAAAKRANQVALSLQSLLNDPDGAAKTVLILSKATASEAALKGR